jgi:hypothetical protein
VFNITHHSLPKRILTEDIIISGRKMFHNTTSGDQSYQTSADDDEGQDRSEMLDF